MNSPYYKYKDYMIDRYGEALFRVPIDFDQSCPNRKEDGSGGCSFCSVRGGRAMQTIQQDTVAEQMKEAIRFAKDRYNAKKYMAYIQAFTASFEPEMCQKYIELLNSFEFSAVSIGTRPDCLTKEAYDFLKELNKSIEVWIELGVQTVHDKTLQRINRGHSWEESKEAIIKLHEKGIKVAVHAIIGLPGENEADYIVTAKTLSELPIDGIKMHNLHVVKNTRLAEEYNQKPFPVYNEYDYAEYLMEFIRYMPSNIPIMRLSTDSLEDEMVAPIWHMEKSQFRDYVTRQMICREIVQGDKLENSQKIELDSTMELRETKDGSVTFWNDDYKEHYHTPAGARLEAEQKYIIPSKLKNKLKEGNIKILDICFGLGYNSLCAINTAIKEKNNLSITALEMDKRAVGAASRSITQNKDDLFDWKDCLEKLYHSNKWSYPHIKGDMNKGRDKSCSYIIEMYWGDARHSITKLKEHDYDIVFLDAFSTQRNSELWTVDFFKQIKKLMKPGAVILTYCAAIPVRAGLIEAGFHVGETSPIGRKRGGTIASLDESNITIPVPESDLELMKTTRGLVYRDPYHLWNNKEILRDREMRIVEMKKVTN